MEDVITRNSRDVCRCNSWGLDDLVLQKGNEKGKKRGNRRAPDLGTGIAWAKGERILLISWGELGRERRRGADDFHIWKRFYFHIRGCRGELGIGGIERAHDVAAYTYPFFLET